MFHCSALNEARTKALEQIDIPDTNLNDHEKLAILLQKQNIESCGKFI